MAAASDPGSLDPRRRYRQGLVRWLSSAWNGNAIVQANRPLGAGLDCACYTDISDASILEFAPTIPTSRISARSGSLN